MARVRYLTRDTGGTPALFDRLERERKVPTANIFMALAHAPGMLDGFLSYANSLREGRLSAKLREMAILTVGHCTDTEYEVAHHQSHGQKAGISAEQLKAIEQFETSDLFSDEEKAVMAFAKESTLKVHVSEAVWRELARFLDERQLVELTLSVGWYNSGVRLMGALSIDLEDSYKQHRTSSV